jgi:RNA-directed DNA polymerase
VGELKSSGKPFEISKREVWEAWEKVRGNKGAPGVDGCSIADFEEDLKSNLYKVWNRMSSGSYFPPAVRAVEIPKPHGGGIRVLGVPTGIANCAVIRPRNSGQTFSGSNYAARCPFRYSL